MQQADVTVGSYQNLRGNGEPGQAHHISQNAAFKQFIQYDEGLCVKLEGSILQPGSQHYVVHSSLEQFWDQYRPGGPLYGVNPTVADYNYAVFHAMTEAGYSDTDAFYIMHKAFEQQTFAGLIGRTKLEYIPRPIYNVRKR